MLCIFINKIIGFYNQVAIIPINLREVHMSLMKSTFLVFISLIIFVSKIYGVSGTTGTPLGGMGTGYVVFDAQTGDFAASNKIPPFASGGTNDFENRKCNSSGFHFFVNGTTVIKAKTEAENSIFPLYTADFVNISDVSFNLLAFGPLVSGNSEINLKLAQSPLAFFEIAVQNNSNDNAEVAVAMEFANTTDLGDNLLGGADTGTAVSEQNAISFDMAEGENAFMLVSCSQNDAAYSAGSLGSFDSEGMLQNGRGNLTAAKCTILPGAMVRFRFVLSWFRYFSGIGNENYYYHNFYNDSKEAAEFGMDHFDQVRKSLKKMVTRVMGSNFPQWYKDRLLNNLYPLVHNMQCAKDGRVAFWEGRLPIIGALPVQGNAQTFYSNNWPEVQWRQMMFWARTQHTGENEDAELKGQIHHDFNTSPDHWTDEAHYLCDWDDYLRDDYWYEPNTTHRSDLNSMFILNVYELMLATGDRDSIIKIWPYVKNTGNRLIYQCFDQHLPQHKVGYDDPPRDINNYSQGMALAAFKAVREMALYMKDSSTVDLFGEYYTKGRDEIKNNIEPTFSIQNTNEVNYIAGYNWARYLCFPAIMDLDIITTGYNKLKESLFTDSYKLLRSRFTILDDFCGTGIAIGKVDTAFLVSKMDYDLIYDRVPEAVFWQSTYPDSGVYNSYTSAPCVWRSYFQITGYLLDKLLNRLWIRPTLPSEMNGKIEDAPLLNSDGWGTLNYEEYSNEAVCQKMTISFDTPVSIQEFIFKDNTDGARVCAYINGTEHIVQPEGTGYDKNLYVKMNNPIAIGPEGILIEILKESNVRNDRLIHKSKPTELIFKNKTAGAGGAIRFSVDKDCYINIDIIALNGNRIATIYRNRRIKKGIHIIQWDGKTDSGLSAGSMVAVLRMRNSSGTVSKPIFVR